MLIVGLKGRQRVRLLVVLFLMDDLAGAQGDAVRWSSRRVAQRRVCGGGRPREGRCGAACQGGRCGRVGLTDGLGS